MKDFNGYDGYKASVELPPNWSQKFEPEQFYTWAEKNKITDDEWNFTTSRAFGNPTMWFRKPEDAIAFRLTFDI